MSEKTTVVLTNDNNKVGDITLDLNHAERLLKMPKNGGWKLPKNSSYKLEKNGVVRKSNKRNTQKPKEQGDD